MELNSQSNLSYPDNDNQHDNTAGDRNSVNSNEKIKAMEPQIKEASAKTGVPVKVLEALLVQESRGISINNMQKSGGLMQLSQAKFDELKQRYPNELAGKTFDSPEGQVMGAALFLKEMKAKSGSWDGAIALYNGGENSGGKLNDPNYLNSVHETMRDIDNNIPIPS